MHANAFGFGVTESNFDNFIKKTNEELSSLDFQVKYNIDLEFENSEISNFEIIDIAECADIWGQEIAEPLILLKNVMVHKDNLYLFKGKVLKIENENGLSFVNLSSSQEEFDNLYSEFGYKKLNIIGTCSINDYDQRGQIIIKDYEIVGKGEYFF